MTRSHVYLIAGTILMVLGFSNLVGCGCCLPSFTTSSSTVTVHGVTLEHERTLQASSGTAPRSLALDFEAASITVTGEEASGIRAEVAILEKEPNDAELSLGETGIEVRSKGGFPVHVRSVVLHVPPGTPVSAKTHLGGIAIRGIEGASEVSARTDCGSVTLKDLKEVASVRGTSNLGRVSLASGRALGGTVLETSSGSVDASDLDGIASLDLRTRLGSARAGRIKASGPVTLRSDSGSVSAEDLTAPSADLATSLGSVTARRCTLDVLKARSSCGSVRCIGGTIKTKDLHTDLGRVSEGP